MRVMKGSNLGWKHIEPIHLCCENIIWIDIQARLRYLIELWNLTLTFTLDNFNWWETWSSWTLISIFTDWRDLYGGQPCLGFLLRIVNLLGYKTFLAETYSIRAHGKTGDSADIYSFQSLPDFYYNNHGYSHLRLS